MIMGLRFLQSRRLLRFYQLTILVLLVIIYIGYFKQTNIYLLKWQDGKRLIVIAVITHSRVRASQMPL